VETKFTKSTDKEHVVKLESSILYAIWDNSIAYAGGEVGFEVKTLFVGEGSKIKIVGKSENGKKLGEIKDKIYRNRYTEKLWVPDDIKPGDQVYLEVELSQLGLSAESSNIPVMPRLKVANLHWDKNEARRGDKLTLSAEIEGYRQESEVKVIIYERSQEGNHDRIAEIPAVVKKNRIEVIWEYDYHDSTLNIASENELQKYDKSKHYNQPEYFFTLKVDNMEYGKEQESGLLKFKDWVEISLQNHVGAPVVDQKYILHLPDGSKREGQLDSDGYAHEDDIPPGEVTVEFPDFDYVAASDNKKE
jgi:hypothetical protein